MLKLRTSAILVLATVWMTPALLAQPKPAAAKPDPEVKAKLDEFKKLIKDRKGAKDGEAIKIIDSVLTGFDKLHPKDKRAFATALYELLKSSRIKRKPTDARLFKVSVVALGKTGTDGSKYLANAFKNIFRVCVPAPDPANALFASRFISPQIGVTGRRTRSSILWSVELRILSLSLVVRSVVAFQASLRKLPARRLKGSNFLTRMSLISSPSPASYMM